MVKPTTKGRRFQMTQSEYKKFKTCGRKKAYSRESTARKIAFKRGKNAYKCEYCGEWHIGGELEESSD